MEPNHEAVVRGSSTTEKGIWLCDSGDKGKKPIVFLDAALEDGLKGAFPTIYTMNDDNERLSASNLEELIEGAVKLIIFLLTSAARGCKELIRCRIMSFRAEFFNGFSRERQV